MEFKKQNILEKLEKERVFSIKKEGDNFRFTEECDQYFSMNLTKEDVYDLIMELTAMISEINFENRVVTSYREGAKMGANVRADDHFIIPKSAVEWLNKGQRVPLLPDLVVVLKPEQPPKETMIIQKVN